MKIYQAIVADAVSHFDFYGMYGVVPYHSQDEPVVVFGVYDIDIVEKHKGPIVLHWTGNDSRSQYSAGNLHMAKDVINTTCLPAVRDFLESHGISCSLSKYPLWDRGEALLRGNMVYAYLNHYKPQYHGSDIVDGLNINHNILKGDFTVLPQDWRNGIADEYYGQCFIGLCLSDFAGGGGSIIEMGLRGIRVVTNVLEMPHTIPWSSVKDIERAIEAEASVIGTKNIALASDVRTCFVEVNNYDTNILIYGNRTL